MAFCVAEGELCSRLARRVKNSFESFHPEVPFFIFSLDDEKKVCGKVVAYPAEKPHTTSRLAFMKKLLDDFLTVIFFDVDVVVAGRLTEFLEADYDVAGSLNVPASMEAVSRFSSVWSVRDMAAKWDGYSYLNAGVMAVTNKQFVEDWQHLMRHPLANRLGCQLAFNWIAKNGRYNLKIVDEEDVYYNERSRDYWDTISIKDGKLFCNNRQLKVLHWAGGTGSLRDNLSAKMFSQEVREFLNKVTKTTDFTDIVGLERWWPIAG